MTNKSFNLKITNKKDRKIMFIRGVTSVTKDNHSDSFQVTIAGKHINNFKHDLYDVHLIQDE